VDDVERREDGDREVDRREGLDRVPPDEGSAEQRADGHPDAQHGALPGQFLVDIGARRALVHGVDEPRLERTGVQGTEGPHQGGGTDELPEALGEEIGEAGDDVDACRRDIDGSSPEGIGEATGGQLEGETHESGHGSGRHGLRDREPAVGLQEDEDADDEADREPAGEVEQQEDPVGLLAGEGRGHRRGTCSMSTG